MRDRGAGGQNLAGLRLVRQPRRQVDRVTEHIGILAEDRTEMEADADGKSPPLHHHLASDGLLHLAGGFSRGGGIGECGHHLVAHGLHQRTAVPVGRLGHDGDTACDDAAGPDVPQSLVHLGRTGHIGEQDRQSRFVRHGCLTGFIDDRERKSYFFADRARATACFNSAASTAPGSRSSPMTIAGVP